MNSFTNKVYNYFQNALPDLSNMYLIKNIASKVNNIYFNSRHLCLNCLFIILIFFQINCTLQITV